jgi:hypothetical protein
MTGGLHTTDPVEMFGLVGGVGLVMIMSARQVEAVNDEVTA